MAIEHSFLPLSPLDRNPADCVSSASYIATRENYALGGREEGGIAAQVQSLADKNKQPGHGFNP